MLHRTLHEGWTFRHAGPPVGFARPNAPANPWRPARVPGNIHHDLVAAGMLADPFELEHEAGAQWVSETDWAYRCIFEWRPQPENPRRVLRFEGLDTVCEIRLNGATIGRHDNMFVPLEIDVTDRLVEGSNELEVVFDSAVRTGMLRRQAYFEKEGIPHGTAWFDERAFVRKAQYMSGWDWGPRLVSCGIWQPVALLEFAARIVRFTVFQERLDDGRFRVWSETEVEGEASLETTFDGQSFVGDFNLTIDQPRLWQPNGEGEPFLYPASARLSSGHEVHKRTGLRTIRLLREKDAIGESFEFEVNGRRIYARGANWIPNDSFPSQVTPADHWSQIQACRDLNMNMLRVWGGGLYELEPFYDACDELGILVWQDFPYGCSYYPDGPEAQAVAAREAEHHIRRLRDRACLALWCGNNENDVMWQGKWGGPETAPPRYYGDHLYGKALAEVCAKLDPSRPYLRSSPIGYHDGGQAYGDEHYWDVWHGRGDWRFYAESNTRFSSEFGFASACGADAWRRAAMEPCEHSPHDLPVVWHDKTNKAHETFVGYVDLHYPESKTLEDWIYFSQLNQRDALRFGIEHYRTNPYCRGTLIWQFNDCWPVQSWAVQDYARQLKIAGFEMRRLYAPVLLSIRSDEGRVEVWGANDGADPISETLDFSTWLTTGETQSLREFSIELAPRERKLLLNVPTNDLDPIRTVFRASLRGKPETETWRPLGEPRAMEWPAPRFALRQGCLTVEGLAYDLVVDVEGSAGQTALADTAGKGNRALCVANDELRLRPEAAGGPLRVRSLAGIVSIALLNPRDG